MAKQYHIHIRGPQREEIDADLVARLVVMLGRELADDAKQAIAAEREAAGPTRSAPYARPDVEKRGAS
jgi:hypothetical protein